MGNFRENESLTFSMKVSKSVTEQFKEQAKLEHIKQGKLFEKILNAYLGNPIEGEFVPFNINLFWIDNTANNETGKNYGKEVYTGYGIPVYISHAFDIYGRNYSTDIIKKNNPYVMNDYHSNFQATEIMLIKAELSSSIWLSFDTEIKCNQIERDFHIKNPSNYHYLNAFRIFKEMKDNKPIFMVNEQLYLINNDTYSEALNTSINTSIGHNTACDQPVIYMENFDLSVSTLYVINDITQAKDKIKLDRAYLFPYEKDDIKHIFEPTFSKDDPDFEEKIKKFSF